LFVAGGIGITPLLPMIRAAEAAGAEWAMIYGGRKRSSMAFLEQLTQYGSKVTIEAHDQGGSIDLPALLKQPRTDTLVYCCGPERLMAGVETECNRWPTQSLRVERFSPKPMGEPVFAEEFEVVLRQAGVTLKVLPHQSILQVVEAAGVQVLCSCCEGTCGSCETPVLEGSPDHRDSVLTDYEKESNRCMMICVSRSRGPRLVLDL
jgi:ferredoxin-NADP reductase